MKLNTLVCLSLLLGSLSASADSFSEDCDSMRETVVKLTSNLATVNSISMKMASELAAKNGAASDLKMYNAAVREIADTIDSLTYKIDQKCK